MHDPAQGGEQPTGTFPAPFSAAQGPHGDAPATPPTAPPPPPSGRAAPLTPPSGFPQSPQPPRHQPRPTDHPAPPAATPPAGFPPAPEAPHDAQRPEPPQGPGQPSGPHEPARPATPPPFSPQLHEAGADAGMPPDRPATPGFANPPGGPEDPGPADAPARRSRKGLFLGIGAAVVVLALIGGGISWFLLRAPNPDGTAEAYVAAWNSKDYADMATKATGDGLEDAYNRVEKNLGVDKAAVELGDVTAEGDTATASYTATLSLSNAGDWTYEGTLPLTRAGGEWKVDFSPAVIHPDLGDGQTLSRVNERGERGHILAADGSRLDTEDAPGSVKMLVGQVGPATKDDLKDLGPAYEVDDPVGQSGLQKSFQERLAGTASTSIRVVAEGEADQAADSDTVVGKVDGAAGEDITTSLDPALQDAAAKAVVTEGKPTSLVAVRPSTGEVLAVAMNAGDFNRAFDGQYEPGSSFKIISYEALLENGVSTDATLNCTKTTKVGGWPFKNAGDAAYGKQSLTEAFATSCNTALVTEVDKRLTSDSLTKTAEVFGMNADLNIGLPTRTPSFPAPKNATMLAAQSIGQGQVISTPLHMATVPAAIQNGSWRSPVLVTDPKLPDQPKPRPIPNAEQLRPMMRAVVTDGTAKKAGFKGEVYGKTGSAEFGTAEDEDDELESHAWMVGYKGDLAFAVVVEGGGGGGSVAGPVGAKFANAV
ncbi:penicillin-binding transpeptidase domain-containing protein [Nocardiopsis gilva]|uniref:penicillin-binding transpeptidase domain-containing protein n=2 Tax=Nocardiopsis gilva TaxID=280236 RepID=UPI001268A43A|nr:penicillin-binding transpeptidase domain-containing protein [Nocardiopsis gilva]